MKPTDVTIGTFESKVIEAAKLVEIEGLTALEVAQIKERIQFVLFGSNPAQLTVAQLGEWVRRLVPGLRRSGAVLAAHAKISDGVPVTAELLPDSLRAKVEPVEAQDEEALAAGEVFCSLVGARKVRFQPANMVVTPLRIDVSKVSDE